MDIKNSIQKCIDTVRVLSADAVQNANSRHPGTPMALSTLGPILGSEIMHYKPNNTEWANRDRFVLSCCHAGLLQYSYLYLTGYNITLDDLKQFRQLHSITAGHPEYGLMPGIEVTTGPLGQGFANGVRIAIAQKYMAERYNRPDFKIFDYKTYAICSDEDLMEGITAEAASMADRLGLGNMIYFYDNNKITIEGHTELAFDEDVSRRFEAYGWNVQNLPDNNDLEALSKAIKNAQNETGRPSLSSVRSIIGYGSPNKHNSAAAHGSPLGKDEVKLVEKNFGFDPDKNFVVTDEVLSFYRPAGKKRATNEEDWNKLYKDYKKRHPNLAKEYEAITSGKLPVSCEKKLPVFEPGEKMATCKASGETLNAIAEYFPQLIGGSADLVPSTDINLDAYKSFSAKHPEGRNFHFGIREHAMGAIINGMALSNYLIPYGAKFLIFSDYMRPPLRLAAIMKIRPADTNETAHAWRVAIKHTNGPVAIILSGQGLPIIDQKTYAKAENLEKDAYILSDSEGSPDIILIASGSEVHLIIAAQEELMKHNIRARVVSMPSWDIFDKQEAAYREKVLPKDIRKRLALDAGSPIGWLKYTTDDGDIIGINQFGESAPGDEIMKDYGFSVENVVKRAKALLSKKE